MEYRLRDVSPSTEGAQCRCCCGTVLVALLAGFLGGSVKQLDVLHWGVLKNDVTRKADLTKLWTPGRHWVGFYQSFAVFPSYIQTIEFTDDAIEDDEPSRVNQMPRLETRDKEAKKIWLDVSVQYRLQKDGILALYKKYLEKYEKVLVAELRDNFLKVGNQMVAREFWENYTHVNDMFFAACQEALEPVHTECVSVQVWAVELTDEAEKKLEDVQESRQRFKTGYWRNVSANVRANTDIMMSTYRATIQYIEETGNKNASIIINAAQAYAEGRMISADADALELVREQLRVPPPSSDPTGPWREISQRDLARFQKYAMLNFIREAHMVFDFPRTTVEAEERVARFLKDNSFRRLDAAVRLEEKKRASRERSDRKRYRLAQRKPAATYSTAKATTPPGYRDRREDPRRFQLPGAGRKDPRLWKSLDGSHPVLSQPIAKFMEL